MKIVIPVNGKENPMVNENLARGPYFVIVKSDGDLEYIENEAAKSPSGAGIQAAQTIVESGNILLAPKVGIKAENILRESGIVVFQTEGRDLEENLQKYRDGKLKQLI